MGVLDNTSVTVDAILTKKGREKLAKGEGQFRITKFALGDDEIDYNLYDVTHPNGSNFYGEAIENMPKSMSKKWTKAQYGRERYLSKEFIKHSYNKSLSENKLRNVIKQIIKEELNEAKMVKLILPVKDRKKVVHILQKQLKLKVSKDFEYGGKKGSDFVIELDKKFENEVIELFMKTNIKVRG